jgi:pyridoxamine 5'-phosphate oxidase
MEHPAKLRFSNLPDDPFALFALWMKEAAGAEPRDPDACALATVDADGLPDVRMVLLKKFDPRGFVFFTNTESAKGQELEGNLKAAIVLHWKSLNRQIRIRGPVERISSAESDEYFATRPRGAQIGAWASQQSRPLDCRETLEVAVAKVAERYPGRVPRPPYWGGYRVVPLQIEFWIDQPSRLHDRFVYSRANPGVAWRKEMLYP